MKTYSQIKKVSVNDYAFFKGVSTTDAKWVFAGIIFPNPKDITTTKSGSPKIPVKYSLDKSLFDFNMVSNSKLDGQDQMEYLCDFYNKGVPIQKLRDFSESETFKKSLSFTGKHSIVNQILNTEQLLKLKRTWLLMNCNGKYFSKKTVQFINNSDWAKDYLLENRVDPESEIKRYHENLRKK